MNRPTNDRARHWYVLEFHSLRFNAVFEYLNYLDADWYCPMMQTLYKRPDKQSSYRKRKKPLFTGYLFIRINFEEMHTSTVTQHQFVRGFVNFGEEPVYLSEELLSIVKSAEAEYDNNCTGIKSIPREFASILLNDNPEQRAKSLLNYGFVE